MVNQTEAINFSNLFRDNGERIDRTYDVAKLLNKLQKARTNADLIFFFKNSRYKNTRKKTLYLSLLLLGLTPSVLSSYLTDSVIKTGKCST